MREFKSIPNFTKAGSGNTRTGIFAVFGHLDNGGDRLHPGAFAKTLAEGRQRAKFLWNHSFGQPPIASITEVKELTREELPAEIRAWAGDVTGGMEVTREYYTGNELADWVLKAIDAGDVDEMSFGYDVKRVEFTMEGEGAQAIRIRELKEVKLYDISDVLWGMNDATLGVKDLMGLAPTLPQMAAFLEQFAHDVKAGRRNAASDMKMLNAIHRASVGLGADECAGIVDAEKTGNAGADSKIIASPFADWLQVSGLELDALTI